MHCSVQSVKTVVRGSCNFELACDKKTNLGSLVTSWFGTFVMLLRVLLVMIIALSQLFQVLYCD